MGVTVALIGAGGRGCHYAEFMKQLGDDRIKITAVVDPIESRRLNAAKRHGISSEMVFASEDEFYKLGKVCDAAMVMSFDQDHHYSLLKCMDLGYDILVEKPITTSSEELIEISDKQKQTGARIMVCHVLRYMHYFERLKQLLDDKEIGDIVGIDHTEYIGHWHMGVSFVRGPWRNKEMASPISLQKICHDFDILAWLLDSDYDRVYASGKLNFFKEENAPAGATEKCNDCPHKETCVYAFDKVYNEGGLRGWVRTDEVMENAQTCIFKIPDNNVCDHLVGLLKYKNGVDVTFTMTAFHQHSARYMRIFGTTGSIIADVHKHTITIQKYVAYPEMEMEERVINPGHEAPGHFSGDKGLVAEFEKFVKDKNYQGRTIVEQSFQSHHMSFDVEKSRVNDEVVINER